MRYIDAATIGIDEGHAILFSDFEHDGQMWASEGPRVSKHSVEFSQPFFAPPSVQVSLSMFDVSNLATARLDIKAENITEAGFDIVFRTWSDTKIARARASWFAIGGVSHPSNWDL